MLTQTSGITARPLKTSNPEPQHKDDMQHGVRVASMVKSMLQVMGASSRMIHDIALAAALHDCGKRFVSPQLLEKASPLTDDEYASIKQHVWFGYRHLAGGRDAFPPLCGQVALLHHERYDGHGYPLKLRGNQIPFAARLVAVADVFDALTSHRPYKAAWSVENAMAHIRSESGRHFDPVCVRAINLAVEAEKVGTSAKPSVVPISRPAAELMVA